MVVRGLVTALSVGECAISSTLWSAIVHYLRSKPPGRQTSFDLVCIDNAITVMLFVTVNSAAFITTANFEPLPALGQRVFILAHNSLLYHAISSTLLTLMTRYLHVFHAQVINEIQDESIRYIARVCSLAVTFVSLFIDFLGPIRTKSFLETLMSGSFEMKGDEKPGPGVIILVGLLAFSSGYTLTRISAYNHQDDEDEENRYVLKKAIKIGLSLCAIFITYFTLVLSGAETLLALSILQTAIITVSIIIPYKIVSRNANILKVLRKKTKNQVDNIV